MTEGATDQHYTGKLHDLESQLDDFGARFYEGTLGRFISPDWSSNPISIPFGALNSPQSLNLYAYVGNNPLSNVDPDGHACDDGSTQCWLEQHAPQVAQANAEEQWSFSGSVRGWLNKAATPSVVHAQEAGPFEERDDLEPMGRIEDALEPVNPRFAEGASFDWMNPGPLSEDVARTFRGGRYTRGVVGRVAHSSLLLA